MTKIITMGAIATSAFALAAAAAAQVPVGPVGGTVDAAGAATAQVPAAGAAAGAAAQARGGVEASAPTHRTPEGPATAATRPAPAAEAARPPATAAPATTATPSRAEAETATTTAAVTPGIDQRQEEIERTLARLTREGQLTTHDQQRLNADFKEISALEARYRQNGLTDTEKEELERRLARLNSEISREDIPRQARAAPTQGRDASLASPMGIDQRQEEIERTLARLTREGRLSAYDQRRLNADFKEISALETRYRQNGLTDTEKEELERRLDRLNTDIGREDVPK